MTDIETISADINRQITQQGDVQPQIVHLQEIVSELNQKKLKYQHKARVMHCLNIGMALIIIALQTVEVVINQVSVIESSQKLTIGTTLSAVGAAIVAAGLKLKWGEKSNKLKKGASVYKKLYLKAKNLERRKNRISEEDVDELCEIIQKKEKKEIPVVVIGC